MRLCGKTRNGSCRTRPGSPSGGAGRQAIAPLSPCAQRTVTPEREDLRALWPKPMPKRPSAYSAICVLSVRRRMPAGQHPAPLIHQLHVMMILSPVITYEQAHQFSRLKCRIRSAACGRTISALMKQCSRHLARTTSQQRSTLPVTGRGTVFSQDSRSGGQQCSPAGGHQLTSLPDGEPANTH